MAGFYYPSPYQNGYGYNPYGTVQIPQPTPQQMMQPIPQQTGQQASPQQQTQIPQQSQIMNGGFVHVQSENEARQYPVAPGNSVTFIDDTQAFCYTKTMSTGQFDTPIFKKFKLVEVPDNNITQNAQKAPSEALSPQGYNLEDYALKADVAALRVEIERLESKFENINTKPKSKTTKEAEKNEQST